MAAPLANTSLLQAFTGLVEVEASKRQHAVGQLLKLLRDSQKGFEDQSEKLGTLPAVTTARPLCNELSYSVTRLTRGMTSSNAAARQGYAVALVETLSTFPNVRTTDVLAQLKEATQVGALASKSEMRDAILGKVVGAIAVAKSGRLAEIDSFTGGAGSRPMGSGATVSLPASAQLVSELLAAGGKKSWLADAAFEGVAAVLASIPLSQWAPMRAALETATPVETPSSEWTPMHLHLALAVEAAWLRWHPSDERARAAAPPCVLKLRSALSAVSISIAGSGSEEGGEEVHATPLAAAALASARALPATHGLWGLLLRRYASVLGDDFFAESEGTGAGAGAMQPSKLHATSHASAQACLSEFTCVWRALVDSTLMRAGPEKRALGLALLETAFIRMSRSPSALQHGPQLLDAWLGPHTLRALVHHGCNRKDALNRSTHSVLRALVACAARRPAIASAGLVALASRGHPAFDKLTHTNTLAELLAALDEPSLLAHVRSLVSRITHPHEQPTLPELAQGSTMTVTGAGAPSSKAKAAKHGKNAQTQHEEAEGEDGVDVSDAALSRALRLQEEEEDEEEEHGEGMGEEGLEAAFMPQADLERLQCTDALLAALKQPSLVSLRQPAVCNSLFTFLAFHTFGAVIVTGTGMRDDAGSAAVTVLDIALLAGPGTAPLALLSAAPPISDSCRVAMRAKLSTAMREVAMAHVPSPVPTPSPTPGSSSPSVDRTLTTAQAMGGVARAIVKAAEGLRGMARQGAAGSVKLYLPALDGENESKASAGDDDDDDDDMDSEDAPADRSPAMAPSAVCTRAVAASDALFSLIAALGGAGAALPGASAAVSRRSEAIRALSSFAALLAAVPASLLCGGEGCTATGAVGRATRIGDALNDLIISSRSVLASPLRIAAKSLTQSGVDSGTGMGKDKKASGKGLKGAKDKESPVSIARAALATAVAQAVSAVGAEEEEEEEVGGSGDELTGADKDAAVFFDALLALLAEPSATLREVVRLAARACAGAGAVCHPSVLGSVMGVLSYGVRGAPVGVGEDDTRREHGRAHPQDAGDDGDDDDEESVLLESGEDALGMLLGTAGDTAGNGKSLKRKRVQEVDEEEEEEDKLAAAEHEAANPVSAAAARAEMELHDRMLEGILRLQKEKTNAAKDGAKRDAHFRFRAFDLLEASISRLAAGAGAGDGESGPGTKCAPPVLVQLLPGLLDVIKRLCARVKAKRAAGNESAAADAAKLVDKTIALVSRAAKAKLPSVIRPAHSMEDEIGIEGAPSSAAAADTAGAEYVSAGVTPEWAITLLQTAMTVACTAPLPAALESAGAVASACLRLLRDPAQVRAAAESALPAGSSPQPALAVADRVVAIYAGALKCLLTERHPHVTAAFFRNALSGAPLLAARLLPTLSACLSTRPCAVPKAFRVSEAIGLGLVLARAAATAWAADLPCAGGAKGAVTVSSALRKALPDFAGAVATVFADSAQAQTLAQGQQGVVEKDKDSKALSSALSTALPAKLIREPLDAIRQLAKVGLLSVAGDGQGKGVTALFSAVNDVARTTSNEQVRRAAGAVLACVGWAAPDDEGMGMGGGGQKERQGGQGGVREGKAEEEGRPTVGSGKPLHKKARTASGTTGGV